MDSKSEPQKVSMQDLIREVSEGYKDSPSYFLCRRNASSREKWNELSALLKDLENLISQGKFIARHIEIYQRILELDDIIRALSKYRRELLQR